MSEHLTYCEQARAIIDQAKRDGYSVVLRSDAEAVFFRGQHPQLSDAHFFSCGVLGFTFARHMVEDAVQRELPMRYVDIDGEQSLADVRNSAGRFEFAEKRFNVLSRCWYGPVNLVNTDYVEKVQFGFYGDRAVGEAAFTWHKTGAQLQCKLSAYSDGWLMLSQSPELMLRIGALDRYSGTVAVDATVEEVCTALIACGFQDATQPLDPDAAARVFHANQRVKLTADIFERGSDEQWDKPISAAGEIVTIVKAGEYFDWLVLNAEGRKFGVNAAEIEAIGANELLLLQRAAERATSPKGKDEAG